MKLHHKILAVLLTLLLTVGVFTQLSLNVFADGTDQGGSEYEENILSQDTTAPDGTIDPEATTEEPTTEEPNTEAPTTEEPTTEEPTTEEPTTVEPTTVEPTTQPPEPTSVTVTAQEIQASGAGTAIQTALNTAKDKGTDSKPFTVKVERGTYTLSSTLFIYSNTNLELLNVTLNRGRSGINMLRIGDYDTESSGVTGYHYRNITINGGTFDGKNVAGTVMKLTHAKNVTLKNITLTNTKNYHLIETAGVDGLTVYNCAFTNMTLDSGNKSYEALQLDVLKKDNIVETRSEDLCMKNVTVEKCLFENCFRGVGSHTAVHNNPHNNINIRSNTFRNLKSAAIQTVGWVNSNITGNTISNAPRAIAVFSIAKNGQNGTTYLPSAFANEGKTTQHYSDSYAAQKSNIIIEHNNISGCGNSTDSSASEISAISVIGFEVTSSESSIVKLPAGNYYCDNVAVKNNLINVRGNGIRVEKTKNILLDSNVIKHTAKNPNQTNDYGIVFRNYVTGSINNNYISNSPVNGIQIDEKCTITQIYRNEIYSPGKYAMGAYASSIKLISENDIKTAAKEGIAILSSSSVTSKIAQNRLSGVKGPAIHIDAKSAAALIEKNTCYKCTENIAYTKSTGKVKVGTNYTTATGGSSISAGISNVYLRIGNSLRFSKSVSPVNTITSYSYTTSNSEVASVDSSNGRIKGLKSGSATITVKMANGKSSSCKVTVINASYVPETSVKLNTTALTITAGNKYTLKATVSPSNATTKGITWSSSNSTVASVSAGVVTAKKAGTCTITAKTYIGKTATCSVTVKAAPVAVTGIKLNTTAVTMTAGTKYTLKATISPSNATNKTVSWSSSNPSVAGMASGGVINAKAAGTCTITAKTNNGKTATCKVTVKKAVAVTGIKLNTTAVTMTAGTKYTLKATISPSNATNKNVTWSSSNPKVAGMAAGGVINAKAKGTCTITAKTNNGKTATCKVTVK